MPSTAVNFRELSASRDAQQIARHLKLLYSELFGPSAVLSQDEFDAALGQWQSEVLPHWAFQATNESDRVVAFFTLVESFAFFAHGRYGVLNELWVDPKERSQGVGKQVVDFCVDFGRKRGWQRIDVSAPSKAEWDRTVAFYEKRGFVLTGRKLKIFLQSQESVDVKLD